MIELIEKAMLAGVGAMSLTQKKAEELVAELKERFNVSEEKGKEMLSRIQGAVQENQQKLEELARQEVQRACERLGLVTAEELGKLEKKVQQLEKQLKTQKK